MVEIGLTDGEKPPYMIDIMGRGSILSYNNVLSGETCLYRAYAISSHSTVLLKISKEMIDKIATTNKTL